MCRATEAGGHAQIQRLGRVTAELKAIGQRYRDCPSLFGRSQGWAKRRNQAMCLIQRSPGREPEDAEPKLFLPMAGLRAAPGFEEAHWVKSGCQRGGLTGELAVVVRFSFCRRDVTDGLEQAVVVAPGHPFQRW